MKWKCRICGIDFEAESSYVDWRSGERIEPQCPDCKGHAVRWIEDEDRAEEKVNR